MVVTAALGAVGALAAPARAQDPVRAPAAAPSAAAPSAAPVAPPALVIVVRHAEKAAPTGDVPLSAEGQLRARALAAALADADVGAVLVTPLRRTAETAAPLAAARGITPEAVPLGPAGAGGVAQHARQVAAAARRHPGRVVLVVGHSNTVPAIVAALGGPQLPDLCDAAYGTLFVVRPLPAPSDAAAGARAAVVRGQYGRADPPEAAGCGAMPPAAPAPR